MPVNSNKENDTIDRSSNSMQNEAKLSICIRLVSDFRNECLQDCHFKTQYLLSLYLREFSQTTPVTAICRKGRKCIKKIKKFLPTICTHCDVIVMQPFVRHIKAVNNN